MRVLVTGGTGFLGARLARSLLELGHQVTVTGRRAAAAQPFRDLGASVILGDLADPKLSAQAVQGQECVLHSGALSAPWGRYQDFYQANVIGTRNIVEACLHFAVQRLVHISSPSIYVGIKQQLNISEDTALPAQAINDYAATKRLAEDEVQHGVQAGLDCVILRPQAIFGPGDQAIVPRLLRANASSGIPLFGSGDHLIDVTYVDNVVDAIVLAMNAGTTVRGRTFNITNGEPIAFRSFLTNVFAQLGVEPKFRRLPLPAARVAALLLETLYRLLPLRGEPVLTRYGLEVLTTSRTLDISRAKHELNYKPKITVAEGSRRYVQWWLSQETRHA